MPTSTLRNGKSLELSAEGCIYDAASMDGELTGDDGMRQKKAPPPPIDVPADWYPDPDVKNLQRYWDGEQWTDDVAPLPPRSADTERATKGARLNPNARSSDDDGEGDKIGVAAPGWYTDPDEAPLQRYWDGAEWTDWTDETYDADDGRAGGGETDPRNDTLATIGWITAIFFPIIGVVVGIILGSRGDRRGTYIVITATVVFIVGIAVWVALLAAANPG